MYQAEDGIRDAQESRGLGDVYKRQVQPPQFFKLIFLYFTIISDKYASPISYFLYNPRLLQ